MSFELTAEYECPACGMHERSKAIDYDSLGYPICPVCGGHEGPLSGGFRWVTDC